MKKMFERIRNLFKGRNKQIKITCSKCGRKLKPIGSMFDAFSGGVYIGQGNMEGFQQWLGWVCMSCGMIFCSDCEHPRMDQPPSSFTCPSCHHPLEAATAMNLKKIGKL